MAEEKNESIYKIIEKVCEEVCNDLCWYSREQIDVDEETGCFEHCNICPLNRLC